MQFVKFYSLILENLFKDFMYLYGADTYQINSIINQSNFSLKSKLRIFFNDFYSKYIHSISN